MLTDTSVDTLLLLGVLAGVLQIIGYVLYLRIESIDPNPVTWFMFAYGTALLTLLEWDAKATVAELILPTTCSILAIYVSVRCWQRARAVDPTRWWPRDWWPDDRWDRFSFITDIGATLGYLAAWLFASWAILTLEQREWAVLIFLFLSNASTFPGFVPILRTTWERPEREHWAPWAIWTAAYAVLGVVTFGTQGTVWHALMFYPASNALMHGLVGLFAARKKLRVPISP